MASKCFQTERSFSQRSVEVCDARAGSPVSCGLEVILRQRDTIRCMSKSKTSLSCGGMTDSQDEQVFESQEGALARVTQCENMVQQTGLHGR